MKTDIASKIFSLPLKNGLLFIQNKNISLCTVSNKGTLNLTSKRQEKTFIPNHTIPILRGIEFFIYSVLDGIILPPIYFPSPTFFGQVFKVANRLNYFPPPQFGVKISLNICNFSVIFTEDFFFLIILISINY